MYKLNFKNTTNRYSKKDLFDNIKIVWDFKNSQPFISDMQKEPSSICFTTYFNRFGSWKNALIEFVKYENNSESPEYQESVNIKKCRKSINNSLRYDVMRRDSFKCCYCGGSPATHCNVILEIDHILPVSKGGTNDVENLKTICKNCNIGKFNKQ